MSFSTLLDIDKLTPMVYLNNKRRVLVLCWILINLHKHYANITTVVVLVLCWILINLHASIYYSISLLSFSTLLDIDKLTPR